LTFALAACSSGTSTLVTNDLSEPDLQDMVHKDSTVPHEDTAAEFDAIDIQPDTRTDLVEALPGYDEFGMPCAENSRCLSGLCLFRLGEKMCSMPCAEECPESVDCRPVGAGPDLAFACVSKFPTRCLPCRDSDDCMSTGGPAAFCGVQDSKGNFCSAPCSSDSPCPEGYMCVGGKTVDGTGVQQCVPVIGECPCTAHAISAVLFTPCFFENSFGKCEGQRTCQSAGLTECDAAVPAVETCHGEDDDCDGNVDEGEGSLSTCDDANPCTKDACKPDSGCSHEALSGISCTDEDSCTVAETCVNGVCQTTSVKCDDSNVCTKDICTSEGGCLFEPVSGDCDDGNPCTIGDTCKVGQCEGTAVPVECQKDNDCKTLEDGNLCNGTLICVQNGPIFQCEVDPATVVTCQPPEGKNKLCLIDWCNPTNGVCSYVPANSGGPCEDGNACTYGEICSEGACLNGAALNCTDSDPCTDDSCQPGVGCVYSPNSMACEDGNLCTTDACNLDSGCMHNLNSLPCDDGDICTLVDKCSAGVCAGTGAMPCNDGNVCTDDSCKKMTGCVYAFNSSECNDDNMCTSGDICVAGECVGSIVPTCECNTITDCAKYEDGNKCNGTMKCDVGKCILDITTIVTCSTSQNTDCKKNICLPLTGQCSMQNTLDGTTCSDASVCTLGDKCQSGSCVGTPITCADSNPCSDDLCDKVTGCYFSPNTAPCDDKNACTKEDTCFEGHCAGITLSCDDGNVCTYDRCKPVGGCYYIDNMLACNDQTSCTTGDTCSGGKCIGQEVVCDDLNQCTKDSCDPVKGCIFTSHSGACDDGNPCTLGDSCVNGVCAGAGGCNDNNPCTYDICDPGIGCTHINNTLNCDDSNACTINDKCGSGACKGVAVSGNDSKVCTDDACDKTSGC